MITFNVSDFEYTGALLLNPWAYALNLSNSCIYTLFPLPSAYSTARAYKDIAVAVINTNYAIPAGLFPSRDALFVENKNLPYGNLIVVRQADISQP